MQFPAKKGILTIFKKAVYLGHLVAIIRTYPGSEVLSFKSSFIHIELKHVYLKETVVRGYGQELFSCCPDGALVACKQVQQGSI
jgi:hypothetical protein